MKLILRLLINAAALILITRLVPGVLVSGWYAAIIAALILGLVNVIIRPIIILLTLPLNIVTLGLFTLIINAFMFELAASIVKGFTVTDFAAAFFGALAMSIVSMLVSMILTNTKRL